MALLGQHLARTAGELVSALLPEANLLVRLVRARTLGADPGTTLMLAYAFVAHPLFKPPLNRRVGRLS